MVLQGNRMDAGVWYRNKYPTDDCGACLREGLTFGDLWDCLRRGKDFYRCCGVGDSLVRERLFVKIAEIYHVSYEFVYGMWIASPNA